MLINQTEQAVQAEQFLLKIWQSNQRAIQKTLFANEANAATRQDLLQDIFLAAYQSVQRLQKADNPRAYLFRIMHNVIVDHIACAQRHKWQPLDERVHNEVPSETNLEAELEAQQQNRRLIHAIRRLSLSHRQVILLALEEWSAPEIAGILQISHGAVRVRLSRAKSELLELLQHEA